MSPAPAPVATARLGREPQWLDVVAWILPALVVAAVLLWFTPAASL